MSDCLNSKNYLNLFICYLDFHETICLSLVNKNSYSYLNPENNPLFNTIIRDICFKKYFNINNQKNYKQYDENNLDDYKKTKNNWKTTLKNIHLNSKENIDPEINKDLYKCFQIHCYFPYDRKENAILEYKNSTLHQTICYDIKKNDCINHRYYDKYFDDKSINYKNSEIEPLKKGLYFEKELINFKKDNKKSPNKKIMDMIIKYSFKDLDKVYYTNLKKSKKNKKKKQKKLNSIIYFLIWLNHTFIIFINLLFNYVSQFSNFKDGKKIIIEYSKVHSNLINFGLMINEKFHNVNIIFNLFKRKYKGNSPISIDFKIYNLFLNIMENNFYQKLKPILNNKIQKILDLFYKENFEKEQIVNTSFNSNIIETNYTEQINEENEKDEDYYLNDDSLFDNNELDEEISSIQDNNFTNQKIIEDYTNLILDFSINEQNAVFINHSNIELNESYNEIEYFVIKNFMENIHNLFKDGEDKTNYIEDLKSLNTFFSFIKKLSKTPEVIEDNQIKLIKRTKMKMLEQSKTYIFNYLNELLNKNFIYELNNLNIKKNYFINKGTSIVFKDNIIKEAYINKIEEIKQNLINKNLNNIKGINDNLIESANNYINSNQNKIANISKEIILFYINQIYSYKSEDKAVIDILLKKEKDNDCKNSIYLLENDHKK